MEPRQSIPGDNCFGGICMHWLYSFVYKEAVTAISRW
jgi:hypothetical protein